MKTLKKFIILICLLNIYFTFSTERELYVDNFSNILGTYHLETELLEFAKNHEINTLILYDLHKINKRFPLGDETKNGVLASFIVKAKVEYGIQKISASGESGDFFTNVIHPYNISRKNSKEKIRFMKKAIIVAKDLNGAIGKNGQLPWKIKEDMRIFKSITEGSTVVMGRKTFNSITS